MYLLKKNYENIVKNVFLWIFKVQENQGVMFLVVPPKDEFAQIGGLNAK
jgi:hypothetical protein